MEKLGYGWETLHRRHPRLIYGAVSGFGHTGPEAVKPAYDMVVQARGGVMSITGEAGRDPVRVGASIGDIVAGMYLTQGVLAALISRDQTGEGQKIDIAMLDAQLAILEHAVAITSVTGTSPERSGARHPTITPFETFHAANGLFVIAAGNDTLFARLCDALNLGPLYRDPRFATNPARCDHARLLKRLIETVTLTNTKSHWITVLEAAGVPTGPIQDVAEALADPQLRARNMVVSVASHPNGPGFTAAGNPIKMSNLPDPATRDPAPRLDGDRAAILAWLAAPDGE
jgi:CoA:oxalate CoA-transferase